MYPFVINSNESNQGVIAHLKQAEPILLAVLSILLIRNRIMIIYKATNIVNKKCYIGQTIKSLQERMSNHRSASKHYRGNQYIHRAIRKYGWNNFTWEVIDDTCYLQTELDEMEHHYIKQFHSHASEDGYNLTWGFGNTTTGYKFTKEQSIAHSINTTGKRNGMYGKSHKQSTRHKQSDKKKGIYNGKNNPNSKRYMITHPDGMVEMVECMKLFCDKHDLSRTSMCRVVNGNQHQHKEYTGQTLTS